ncbi:hypothetical protein A8C32_17965 [Flavivirga aquatica]|uniref:Uncharacterized protein n=1 Tax=Flavivirga aquatica TaxID=1849968 RepID=A0A1E5T7G8_9FLAO|nr:hypothetical protein [Flavivirga aquatica]OEK07325.1 hypothetical protein A8C32_17965 [Flavivirga aquatica]
MKTHFFKLLTFVIVVNLTSCKKENTFTDYKYSDKPNTLTCENLNSNLYKEALYAFEDDILNFYKKNNPKSTLTQSYSQFVRNAVNGRIKFEDIVSPHTIKVFEALKGENDLWDAENAKSHLNYKGKTLTCVSNGIKDHTLQTTFNALVTTNSMSPKLFGAPLITKYRAALNDKSLASYIALDLFYAKLFDTDLSKVNLDKPEQQKN